MRSVVALALVSVASGQKVAGGECTGKSSGGLALMGPGQTGVFGCGVASAPPGMSATGLLQMVGGVVGMTGGSDNGGSGPYKALNYSAVPGLPKHTMYQPTNRAALPQGYKLPVILWGNGACVGWGGWFSRFLTEISSYGFFIVANGDPSGTALLSGTTSMDIPDALDWVYKNAGQGDFAHIDKDRVAVAGQSCGGIQAYSASLDPRVKLLGVFNSGLINTENTKLFDKLHTPIGYFLGGDTDIAYANGERDYKNLPSKIPAVKCNLPVGHMATYGQPNGGKFGKAAAAFFRWQLKGEKEMASYFTGDRSPLAKDGWTCVSKNWDGKAAA